MLILILSICNTFLRCINTLDSMYDPPIFSSITLVSARYEGCFANLKSTHFDDKYDICPLLSFFHLLSWKNMLAFIKITFALSSKWQFVGISLILCSSLLRWSVMLGQGQAAQFSYANIRLDYIITRCLVPRPSYLLMVYIIYLASKDQTGKSVVSSALH